MTLGTDAVRRPISFVAVRDDSEGDDLGNFDFGSSENEAFQSLISPSQESEISSIERNI